MSTPLVIGAFAFFVYTQQRVSSSAAAAIDEANGAHGAPKRDRTVPEAARPIRRFIPYEMDVDAHVQGLQKCASTPAVSVGVLTTERSQIGPYDPTIRPVREMIMHDPLYDFLFPLSQNNAVSLDTPYALTTLNLSKGI